MSSFDAIKTLRDGELQETKRNTLLKDALSAGKEVLTVGGVVGFSIISVIFSMIFRAICIILPACVGIVRLLNGDILGGFRAYPGNSLVNYREDC